MLKLKLFIFFSYALIISSFGEPFNYLPRLFLPVVLLLSANPILIVMALLMVIAFAYLIFSSILKPHSTKKSIFYIIIVLFLLSLVPDIIMIIKQPQKASFWFITSAIVFLCVAVYVLVQLKKMLKVLHN